MAGSNIGGALLIRVVLREELDWFRDGVLRQHATQADVASLEIWVVWVLVVGMGGMMVAVVLTAQVGWLKWLNDRSGALRFWSGSWGRLVARGRGR